MSRSRDCECDPKAGPAFDLVATDFDHTLLKFPHPTISDRTAAAIRGVRSLGTEFAIISGRSTQSLLSILERQDIDLDGLFAIGNNGAEVLQAWDRHVLASRRIAPDLTASVLEEVARFDVSPRVAEGKYVYSERVDQSMIDFEMRVNGAVAIGVDDWAASGLSPHKIQINGDREVLELVLSHVQTEFSDQVEAVFSAAVLIEITAKGINKGQALLDLCRVTGIAAERTLTFGDNQNDMSLLREAGMGVAVGNAVEELKATADRVTAPCDEDGVAMVLEELFCLG